MRPRPFASRSANRHNVIVKQSHRLIGMPARSARRLIWMYLKPHSKTAQAITVGRSITLVHIRRCSAAVAERQRERGKRHRWVWCEDWVAGCHDWRHWCSETSGPGLLAL